MAKRTCLLVDVSQLLMAWHDIRWMLARVSASFPSIETFGAWWVTHHTHSDYIIFIVFMYRKEPFPKSYIYIIIIQYIYISYIYISYIHPLHASMAVFLSPSISLTSLMGSDWCPSSTAWGAVVQRVVQSPTPIPLRASQWSSSQLDDQRMRFELMHPGARWPSGPWNYRHSMA